MSDLSDWEQKAHYETEDGDRATLLKQGEEWAICWSYPYPHNGSQLVPYGEHGGQAVDAFVTSREGKALFFDSREQWQGGSV
ncbi:hypothetical protein [Streptomyces sp. NPDC050507]|uniref:hypothetical protein n=1 Tax=Streptomyces sp. NPDC050507 TaxID=3365619 RepID=UPI0037A62D72